MPSINAFSIENFKSFGPKQRLPLSKVNFLFGPNSHGKSSGLIALGVLESALLQRNFKIQKLSHADNSPDIVLVDNLVNKDGNADTFNLSYEIPYDYLGNGKFEFSFKLKNLDSGIIDAFEINEVKDDVNKMVLHISDSEISANFSSKIFDLDGQEKKGSSSLQFVANKKFFEEQRERDELRVLDKTYRDNLRVFSETEDSGSLDHRGIPIQQPVDSEIATLAEALNEMINSLFTIFEQTAITNLVWIGPNRTMSEERIVVDGKNNFIKNSFLNDYSIKNLNEWLKNNSCIDLGYKLVINKLDTMSKSDSFEYGVSRLDQKELFSINDVGSGIAHLFQILLCFFNNPGVLIVQQPEIHLHPSLQIQLARAMFKLASEKNVQLIIETHSEHFIKAAQLEIAKNLNLDTPVLTNDDLSVLYISKDESGFSKVKQMELDKTGAFTEPWPDDFFELSADLTMERLRNSFRGRN